MPWWQHSSAGCTLLIPTSDHVVLTAADDVWLAVLAKLKPKERHRSLALVSRRCWQLLCSPQLLQDLDADLDAAEKRQTTARLHSFVLFLGQRAAGHVQRLSLNAPSPAGQRQQEHGALVAAAVAACRGLEDLSISTCMPLTLSSWLLPLAGSLRRLTTWGGTSAEVRSLDFLTALERLDVGLGSDWTEFLPGSRLPTSLTRFSVGNGGREERLPPQIGKLPRLQHLCLQHPFREDATYAPLTRLSLTRLDLCGVCEQVPSCLSALTTLQALTVDGSAAEEAEEPQMAAQLCGALPHLSQLTFLALALSTATPLQHLTALPSLHTLCWRSGGAVALPPGPWLACLGSLSAPLLLLASNLPLLSAAIQLQQICAYDTVCTPECWPLLRQLLRWAPRQLRLRHLLLGFEQLEAPAWAEAPMPSAAAPLKRPERSASFASLPDGQPRAKRQERAAAEPQLQFDHAGPLLPPLAHESKSAFFQRLGARLRHELFSVAHDFKQDGLYVYKRPVRSGEGTERGALLAAAGSVFHHAVLYVKCGDELTALEFGPANGMDITENMMSEAAAGPVLLRPVPQPDPACLPMLHVRLPVHSLQDGLVQRALAFAQAQPYHALRQNCICFADFMARVLTGGVVKGAPLVFDLLAGTVPAANPPLLQLLSLFQMSWHDVCDGGRLLRAFLQQHPDAALLPPPAASSEEPIESILMEPSEVQACDSTTGSAAAKAAAAPLATPAAGSNPLAALLASLLPPQPAAALASLAPPVAVQQPVQPSDSSGSDDIHFGGVEPRASSAGASVAAASASVASNLTSLASTGDSRTPRGGVSGLPSRRPRSHAAAAR